MTEQKHIIWSSDPDYEDWRGDLEEQYPELSEQERMELMVEQNNDYLDDERCNLNIQLSRPILLIADIGRWDGRYPGYAEIKSGNIRDCLYSEMDYSTWYVNRLGDLSGSCWSWGGICRKVNWMRSITTSGCGLLTALPTPAGT